MKKSQKVNADLLGVIAAATCSLHCSVLPIALAMGSLSMFEWMESTWVEWAFLVSAIVFSLWSILPSYLQNKNKYLPLLLMGGGLIFLTIGMISHTHDGGVRVWSVIGGVLLSLAHLFNYRYQQVHCKVAPIL